MNSLKDQLKRSYLEWIKENTILTDLNGVIEITTPLMDRHNDLLQFYVIPNNKKLLLTDDGYIINDLISSGFELRGPRRKSILQTLLNSYGVQLSNDNELISEATIDNFPQKKHMFLQAMITINDMFVASQSNVQSMFLDDVENFFDKNDIRYSEQIILTGKSGLSHKFDFLIPKSKNSPERLISAMNRPNIDKTKSMLFAWEDSKDTRKHESVLYAFINDSDKRIKPDIMNAFFEYNATPILWSQREDYIEHLSA
ncbi:DUF1829 domain-containing protein [Paenibacillus sp. FSL L8-0436]|uniref:DUF1829 domain-containing protein n=1 Tax=Paenibacillus sp. FSL L8-0436 TaxID=2954686 RepID=UPI00315829DF